MKKYFEIYTKQYYENNNQNGDRIAFKMYWNIFKRYIPSKGRILDFGAGNGFLSRRIAKTHKSYAFEVSEYAGKNIKINSPKSKVLNSEDKISKNYYDGVISLHVLEHINEPEATVKKLIDGLKVGGKILVVMPNLNGLGHIMKKDNWFGYRDKTHISLLSNREWKNIFIKNGLKIIKTSSDGFWDIPYLNTVPLFIQKLIFFPSCALMIALKRLVYPEWFGECLIILAGKD
jgi:2-polyprenyl-3-methyl-5-hydroxy-6-metoxy-1,4-benzoquinol methylase